MSLRYLFSTSWSFDCVAHYGRAVSVAARRAFFSRWTCGHDPCARSDWAQTPPPHLFGILSSLTDLILLVFHRSVRIRATAQRIPGGNRCCSLPTLRHVTARSLRLSSDYSPHRVPGTLRPPLLTRLASDLHRRPPAPASCCPLVRSLSCKRPGDITTHQTVQADQSWSLKRSPFNTRKNPGSNRPRDVVALSTNLA